jgi:hypothetical protein
MENQRIKTFTFDKFTKYILDVYNDNEEHKGVIWLKYKEYKFLLFFLLDEFILTTSILNNTLGENESIILVTDLYNKTLKIDSFFYNIRDKVTELNSIFFMNMIFDFSHALKVKKITLFDASYVKNCERASLRILSLFKHGESFYEKFGFKYDETKTWNKMKKYYNKITVGNLLDTVSKNKIKKIRETVYKYGSDDTKISDILKNKNIPCDDLIILLRYGMDALEYKADVEFDYRLNTMTKKIINNPKV